MEELKLGTYKHYKGKHYEVIAIANHSETLEKMVVYKALEANKEFPKGQVWVRPLEMFCENVEEDGKVMKRFEYVNEG